ncbi:hypothetical protein AaE_009556 [Aphanomyces astaci]|uniref:PTM/DIR17-like Tudor domain-containing protein n=1 Tax=Aphanomyces astaci TaxID=112090 RepID=A0A6A5A4K0_APHAT|nr:hypothetical protein AaE_009556 [Aphanomyces astaci]
MNDDIVIQDKTTPIQSTDDPYLGQRVRKYFADGIAYHGTVTSRCTSGAAVWTVQYDDGDSEDMTQADLAVIVGVKRSIQGYVATTQPLSQGHSVWLVHDLQLVARGRVYTSPPPHMMTQHRHLGHADHDDDDVVCLRITKRFTGISIYVYGTPAKVTAQFILCTNSNNTKSAYFVWWRRAHCFLPS